MAQVALSLMRGASHIENSKNSSIRALKFNIYVETETFKILLGFRGDLFNRGPIEFLFFILNISPVSNNFIGPLRRKMAKKSICRENYRDLMCQNSIGPIPNPKRILNLRSVILLIYEFMA